ncbi:MAG: hypothetical protein IAE82_09425 [Opitutaceae bacterium]|nr:hypothetical protein [Opitutaceae bacterium]
MDATLDLSRWREAPLGLMHRRWAIVAAGLRQLLRTKFFRIMLFLAWGVGLALAVSGFLFTQSIATGGWLESFVADKGARAQAIVSAFTAIVLVYPDVVIGGMFSMLYWLHSYAGLMLSLITLSTLVPSLVTRDRACNALSIYLSRPLTSLDYLLGKLGIIVGVLVLLWTGPLVASWLVSMAFAPEADFFTHSLEPLGRALLFNLAGLVALACVALGVSSISRSTKATIFLWIGAWPLAFFIASFPTTPEWLSSLSFHWDLNQLRGSIFQMERILTDAADSLPLVDRGITEGLRHMADDVRTGDLALTLSGLAALVATSLVVLFRRLRPE